MPDTETSPQPLYVAQRPNKFSDYAGLDHLHGDFEYMVTHLEPRILITGPYGNGKTSLARTLLMAMYCQDRKGIEPCLACHCCEEIGNFVWWGGVIVVTGIELDTRFWRSTRDRFQYVSPYIGGPYVLFIDDFDRADPSQQDRFISLMNGYPCNPMIITASSPDLIQMPIKDRCFILDICKYDIEALKEFVRQKSDLLGIVKKEESAVELLVKLANFNPRTILLGLEYVSARKLGLTSDLLQSPSFRRRMAHQTGN
ncbi:MAG: AAA family ATPase [Bacteroidota bacterium]|jgi:DNA polymerase-3 subunit gamma/tau